ncbi:MAG TPA: hypothetical protein DCS93_23200 [Microscillaceae bacterium]|nr:hypothetical protein [Microscillaceae bacterium]
MEDKDLYAIEIDREDHLIYLHFNFKHEYYSSEGVEETLGQDIEKMRGVNSAYSSDLYKLDVEVSRSKFFKVSEVAKTIEKLLQKCGIEKSNF